MKQITIRQFVRHPKDIESWLPFELTRDGEVVATVLPYDVKQATGKPVIVNVATKQSNEFKFSSYNLPKVSHDVNNANELKFSKTRQAKGRMSH